MTSRNTKTKREEKVKGNIEIEVYGPSGATEERHLYAPRLDTLSGKTIGEVANADWEFDTTFAKIRGVLQKRFSDIKFVPYTEFPMGVRQIEVENIGELVKAKGCDAVIVGNAA